MCIGHAVLFHQRNSTRVQKLKELLEHLRLDIADLNDFGSSCCRLASFGRLASFLGGRLLIEHRGENVVVDTGKKLPIRSRL